MRFRSTSMLVAALLLPTVGPTWADDPPTPPFDWRPIARRIGSPPGVLQGEVYTVTVPRADLDVAVDGMSVPTEAGLGSTFHFFHCSCGKTRLVGQFCCVDYEVNDVIDAVRVGALVQVAAVAPMFLGDRPRVMLVRIQGEGDADALAKLVRAALDWTGDARRTSAAAPATDAATQPTRAR